MQRARDKEAANMSSQYELFKGFGNIQVDESQAAMSFQNYGSLARFMCKKYQI